MKSSFLPLVQGSVQCQEAPTREGGVDPSLCCFQEGLKGGQHLWETPGNIKWLICPGCFCRTTDQCQLQFSPFGGHDFMTVSLNLLISFGIEVLLFLYFLSLIQKWHLGYYLPQKLTHSSHFELIYIILHISRLKFWKIVSASVCWTDLQPFLAEGHSESLNAQMGLIPYTMDDSNSHSFFLF